MFCTVQKREGIMNLVVFRLVLEHGEMGVWLMIIGASHI
jgi:hypothetical protein